MYNRRHRRAGSTEGQGSILSSTLLGDRFAAYDNDDIIDVGEHPCCYADRYGITRTKNSIKAKWKSFHPDAYLYITCEADVARQYRTGNLDEQKLKAMVLRMFTVRKARLSGATNREFRYVDDAVFLKSFPKFTDYHAARTGDTGREEVISRVLLEGDGREPNNGEEGRERNRNLMMESEEISGQGETANGFISDGEGVPTVEGNGKSERVESGNFGERRSGPNGNTDISGVPMSALTYPNTAYSERSVRNGEERTETGGNVEEVMDGM